MAFCSLVQYLHGQLTFLQELIAAIFFLDTDMEHVLLAPIVRLFTLAPGSVHTRVLKGSGVGPCCILIKSYNAFVFLVAVGSSQIQ